MTTSTVNVSLNLSQNYPYCVLIQVYNPPWYASFWPTGWLLRRRPVWRGLVCGEEWPSSVDWGGCSEADEVHRGRHTGQELPLVVSRKPAGAHYELQIVAQSKRGSPCWSWGINEGDVFVCRVVLSFWRLVWVIFCTQAHLNRKYIAIENQIFHARALNRLMQTQTQ